MEALAELRLGTQIMKLKGIFLTAALAALATGAQASAITRTFDLVASDFLDVSGDATQPVSVVSGDFTVTFDPTQDQLPTTNGVSVSNFNLPSTGTEFSYRASDSTLLIGSSLVGIDGFQRGPNQYALVIVDADTANSFVSGNGFQFADADGTAFYSPQPNVTLVNVSAAPEPSSWLMMIAGVVGIGGMLRYRKRQGFAAA